MLFSSVVKTVHIQSYASIGNVPKCGITDKVVNSNDKAQIFNDLSAIIFLSVGEFF